MNGEIITSLENPMIKEARSLNDKKYRKNLQKFLVDGEKLVKEIVCQKLVEIDKIFVDADKISNFDYFLNNFNGKIVPVTAKVIDSISANTTPQGIIAEVFMKQSKELNNDKTAPILILDRIQDPGNMGTIIRTAVATGFDRLVLIDCVDPYSPKVVRSSSGGVFNTEIFHMSESQIIDFCRENIITLFVADMNGENVFKSNISDMSFALVIGNEGQGVSENFKNNGKIISLPMKSQMESLNAAVSASVLMYILANKDI